MLCGCIHCDKIHSIFLSFLLTNREYCVTLSCLTFKYAENASLGVEDDNEYRQTSNLRLCKFKNNDCKAIDKIRRHVLAIIQLLLYLTSKETKVKKAYRMMLGLA